MYRVANYTTIWNRSLKNAMRRPVQRITFTKLQRLFNTSIAKMWFIETSNLKTCWIHSERSNSLISDGAVMRQAIDAKPCVERSTTYHRKCAERTESQVLTTRPSIFGVLGCLHMNFALEGRRLNVIPRGQPKQGSWKETLSFLIMCRRKPKTSFKDVCS